MNIVHRLYKRSKQIFDNACIQTSDLPEELIKQIRNIQELIPMDILYDGEDDIFVENGIQKQLHITILYGVDENLPIISNIVSKYSNVKIAATSIDYFDSEDYTVAIIKHKSEKLTELHADLKEVILNKDMYDTYTPHTTIAYLNKGERIVTDFKPVEWTIKEFEIVKIDGSIEEI